MRKIIILVSILVFLPSLVIAGCTPGGNFLCCSSPSHCSDNTILKLDGNFQVADENNDGLFDPGENLKITFGTVLPSCVNSVDFLKIRVGLYDNDGNLLKNKTALYSTNGNGTNLIEYMAEIKVPEDLRTPRIQVELIANATAVHGSTAAKENVSEAFDSCVVETLKKANLEELPLNQATINDLKNTRDSETLPYVINTQEIYINRYLFTLNSGAGHPYWDFSAYDLAKCLYNWDKCMRSSTTECICCSSHLGGHYGVEANGEWRKFYTTSHGIKPYFKDLYYTGYKNYFNIFWSVSYELSVNKKLVVNCSLNDRQSCSSEHPSNIKGGCTIENPQYDFEKSNIVKCVVYNPENPVLNTTKVSEFKPIDFRTWLGIPFGQTFTIGLKTYIPIYIQNLGLLSDKYKINYEIISGPNFIFLELPNNSTESIKTNEINSLNLRVTLFSTNSVTIRFCANSTFHEQFCSYDNNIEQTCCQTVEIKGGLTSLPDITIMQIIQLLIISSIILLKI
jgi:hypothetical protein